MLLREDDSAARLAAIVTSSDDAIISVGLDGAITSWNAAAERLFGFTSDEAVGQPIGIVIPEDRSGEEERMFVRVRAGEGIDHVETRGRRRDGSPVEISLTVSPIRDAAGQIIGASRIARDMSERRRIERDALRLAAIVESSNDAIVSKDLNGIIQTWNRGAERIFGYTAAEAVGQPILIIIPEDRYDEEADVLARIRAGDPVEHFETVRRRKDGTLLDISLRVSPIRTATGQIIGASKIARDITEQKRLQQEAAAASRAKDTFLATLSHELRTPLNTVLGYTVMLKERVLSPAQREKALDVIGRNAETLTRLVNDVLDTSRIVTGKIRLEPVLCDLTAIVSEAVDMIRPTAETKGLTVVTRLEPSQMVNGDADRLRQIFWNLLSNAVKFTDTGGRIAIAVEPAGGSVRATVEDTGIGILAETLPLVFHRFWQGDSSRTREQGGLGIGLALARHFVELHGGQISVESAGRNQGARFEVLLPGAR